MIFTVTVKFQEILRINFLCYLFESRVRDRSKWPPNQNFVLTNRHFGRTLSIDRPFILSPETHLKVLHAHFFPLLESCDKELAQKFHYVV